MAHPVRTYTPRSLESGSLSGLDSLAALNLERNIVQQLRPDSFDGVQDTLSSLSLLNNLLTEFPVEAINKLGKLRVRKKSRDRSFDLHPNDHHDCLLIIIV